MPCVFLQRTLHIAHLPHMFVALRQLKERAPGSSFDFYCRDAANGLSSSEVTKLVGCILRLRLNMASKNERLIDHGNALQKGGGGANIMRMPVLQRTEVFDEIVHPEQRILRQCTAPLVVSPHQHLLLPRPRFLSPSYDTIRRAAGTAGPCRQVLQGICRVRDSL